MHHLLVVFDKIKYLVLNLCIELFKMFALIHFYFIFIHLISITSPHLVLALVAFPIVAFIAVPDDIWYLVVPSIAFRTPYSMIWDLHHLMKLVAIVAFVGALDYQKGLRWASCLLTNFTDCLVESLSVLSLRCGIHFLALSSPPILGIGVGLLEAVAIISTATAITGLEIQLGRQ